jgi:hypothetical protein
MRFPQLPIPDGVVIAPHVTELRATDGNVIGNTALFRLKSGKGSILAQAEAMSSKAETQP